MSVKYLNQSWQENMNRSIIKNIKPSNKPLLVLGLSIFLAPSMVFAQPQSLKEAAASAIANNPEILSRWHNFKAAGNERDAAFGAFLPRVDIATGFGRESRNDPLIKNNYDRNSTTLTLTQMLYDGFGTRNDVKRLDHAELVRALEFLDTSDSVALEAARAFYDVLRYRKLVSLAEDNYVQHRAVFEQIEIRVKAGIGRRVDLEQAAGRMALAESNLLTETTNLHDVSARFQRIVGEAPAKDMEDLKTIPGNIPENAGDAIKLAQSRHPALRAAIENIRSTNYGADVRKAAYQPRVDLRLREDHGNNLNGIMGQNNTHVAEVVLNWNLFNGFSDRARSRQYVEQVNVAKDLRDKTCRDIRQTLSIAYNDVRKLNEQLKYLDQHQLSIEKAHDAYRNQFDLGQRTLLDLLDSENELYQAKRAYASAEHDLAIAYVRTQSGMGSLLTALGITAVNADELPSFDDWSSDADAATQCPADAIALYTVNKDALNARATELMRETNAKQPVATTPAPQAAASPEHLLAQSMKTWISAWTNHNIQGYLNAYAPEFVPADGSSKQSWSAKRKAVIGQAEDIFIDIADIKIVMQGGQRATTEFKQTYRSSKYQDVAIKKLEWERTGDQWLILTEVTVQQLPKGR